MQQDPITQRRKGDLGYDENGINQRHFFDRSIGRDLEPIGGELAMSGGLIEQVGDNVETRTGDKIVDLAGATVLPGLMDAHCHLVYRDVATPYDIEMAKSIPCATIDAVFNSHLLLIEHGFTTVRDVGSRANIGEVRNAIARGDCLGPRVVAAGRIVTSPGGMSDWQPSHVFSEQPYRFSLGAQIVGPYEAAAEVRRQLKDGVDCIKVGVSGTGFNPLCPAERSGLSPVEFEALVGEAKRQDVPVVAHAESADSVRIAASLGVSSIEHALYIEDDALEDIVSHQVTISPTLSMYRAFAEEGLAMGIPKVIVDEHKRTHERHVQSIRKAHDAGVRIVAGGDAGLTHFPQGQCRREAATYLELLGMSTAEALKTITVNVADLLGISGQVGTIQPGMIADLVVLRGSPLQNIRALSEPGAVVAVFQAGREVTAGNNRIKC